MTSAKHTFDYDGKIAGLYDLYETIGSGHFAVVKLARHVFTDEKVAVKVIDKNKLDPVSRAHLFQEVRCMKLVQHPHVVRLYEVIDTQTKLYLILELGDGGDMYDYIMKHDGGLDVDLARMYFRQIVEAISYCHTLHVVHRDLKPENVIFFEKLGVVKLTDFGFSNKYDPGTKLETSCGSLAYSAPEILLGDSYDAPAVDVWSLGVLLYMLVCGTPPFQEANDSETLTMIMDCKYHVPPHVPLGCKSLISRMLQRDPSRRATLHEIVNDGWLAGDADWTGGLPVMTDALVTTQHLTAEDHDAVIDRMVDGNIAPRHEIVKFLKEDEYNHITATYYLLAERVLSRRRQHELEAARASAGGAGTPGSASYGGGSGFQPPQQLPLMRQASMPGMTVSVVGSAAYRPHRLDHLSLNVSDTSHELGTTSDAISALAASPPGQPSVLSLTGSTTLPPRARKHSLIQEEDEECGDSEAESGISVTIGDDEAFSRRDFFVNKLDAEAAAAADVSSFVSRMDKVAGGIVASLSRGSSGSSTPRRRAATTPAAAAVVAVAAGESLMPAVPPASSRQLRSVCSSPQLLKPLSVAANALRQIYEDGDGTSASEGAADEDDDCPSLKWRPPRKADRRQTLPSPSTSRRLRLVRRKLQGDKKRVPSGSSDTSDTDDADRRDAAQPRGGGCSAPTSCRRKDSTSSGDADSAGPGGGGGTGAGFGLSSASAGHSMSPSSSAAGQAAKGGGCSEVRQQALADDEGGIFEPAGLVVSRALSRSQEAWLPGCDQPAATAYVSSAVLQEFDPKPPAAVAWSVRRQSLRDPSPPPLPGRPNSGAAAVDGVASSAQALTLFATAAAPAHADQVVGGCVGRLAPVSGCSTPDPVKLPTGGDRGGRATCDCVGSNPCSRSSSCSAVNVRHFASKIVESSVSRMSNFSLASHVSSLSAASSSKSSAAGGRCGNAAAAATAAGGDFSRSTPRLSRFGSSKFSKAKLIQVLAKEFSDLSETHSRSSVASLYLEDLGSSGIGMGASMAISCRAMDINDNSISTMPAAGVGAPHIDGKLSVSAGVLTKRKSDADCCLVM